MPYIKQDRREQFPENAGELNFWLTSMCKHYIGDDFNYQKLNDVLGALEGCKQEFYRRIVTPYESKKIEENGDVYD